MDRFIQKSKPARDHAQGIAAQVQSLPAREPGEPPSKRPRLREFKDSDAEDDDNGGWREDGLVSRARSPVTAAPESAADDGDNDVAPFRSGHETVLESSLPAVVTDKEAIEEYEVMRASQATGDGGDTAALQTDKPKWARGQSSIYVDAFSLALDTVLEDEAHLFSEKEKCVFEQWRGLGYEAQYLSVPCLAAILLV